MEKEAQKLRVIREIREEDKIVREAMDIAKRFKVLPYPEAYALLEKNLSCITVNSYK